jgi:hypothetical protein
MIGHDHIGEYEYLTGLSGLVPGVADDLFDLIETEDR